MKSLVIGIRKGDLEKAESFADERVLLSSDHYARRGQTNLEKITYDITIGALGEIAIHRMLKRLGIKTAPPDFNVYATDKKSYDADFTDNLGNKYHCKAQSKESADQYGQSYILQYGGNGHGHVDKLFKNRSSRDYLIPCIVDLDNKEVVIYGAIKVEKLFKNDFVKPPKVKWLEDSKRAVYLDDLFTLTWYERWGKLRPRQT